VVVRCVHAPDATAGVIQSGRDGARDRPIAGAAGIAEAGAPQAVRGGVIVFASDRDKADPGEIYSLAPGSRPRDVSLGLAGEHGLTVAPAGNRIAFWSGRSDSDRVLPGAR
jgi:hypothetical protein